MSDDDAVERAIAALEQLRGKVPGIEAQIDHLRSHRASVIATQPAAMAGDAGKAAAYGSVASETIANSVVVTGHVEGGVYLGPRPHDAGEALAAYRRVLVASVRHLPLRGVDVGAADPSRTQQRLELAAVYIDLEARLSRVDLPAQPGQLQLVKTEQWSVFAPPVLHAIVANRRLVLLGDPGSGKSTFINHLLLCLAAHGLDPDQGWLERLPRWPIDEADLVPIPVLLRDFARSLSRERRESAANPLLLWRFIMKRLADQKLEAAGDALHDALDSGRAILLLDGLDEVPTPEERKRVRAIVDAIARRYPAARLIVTCRTLSYQDPASQLDGLVSAELTPFDEPRIERFIDAWYAELHRMGIVRRDEAGPLALALRDAVHRKDLWRLAPNPLLLTVMALIHTHKGRLPDARARLYEDTVDLLLWRWDELRISGAGEELGLRKLLRDANCQDIDLLRTLWQLAYEAHSQANAAEGEVLADIGEHRLETALAQLHPQKSRDWAMQIIEVMKLRAGLLLERSPGVYTFPHRTFQEYLAGSYLAARANFATEASQLDIVQWREVILLAVGRLVYVNLEVDRPLLLAHALCGENRGGGEAHLQRVLFAADVLLEIGIERVLQLTQGIEIVDRLRRRLLAVMDDRETLPALRATAGERLDRIGDPRFDEQLFWLPRDPWYGFIEIPEGSYEIPAVDLSEEAIANVTRRLAPRDLYRVLIGLFGLYRASGLIRGQLSDPSERQLLDFQGQLLNFMHDTRRLNLKTAVRLMSLCIYSDDEIASRGVDAPMQLLTDRFFISRYPVTEAQFDAYLADTSRTPRRGSRRGKNYPVVNVSFQDALGYCAWLTDKLSWMAKNPIFQLLDSGWRLLPCSRHEWEKALFHHPGSGVFPWDDKGLPERSSAELIAPVGAFPEARTRDGVDELIGNVWECMRDMGGRSVSGGGALGSQVESIFEQPASDHRTTGFRLVLTREPWTPPPEPNTPRPDPDRDPARAALRRP